MTPTAPLSFRSLTGETLLFGGQTVGTFLQAYASAREAYFHELLRRAFMGGGPTLEAMAAALGNLQAGLPEGLSGLREALIDLCTAGEEVKERLDGLGLVGRVAGAEARDRLDRLIAEVLLKREGGRASGEEVADVFSMEHSQELPSEPAFDQAVEALDEHTQPPWGERQSELPPWVSQELSEHTDERELDVIFQEDAPPQGGGRALLELEIGSGPTGLSRWLRHRSEDREGEGEERGRRSLPSVPFAMEGEGLGGLSGGSSPFSGAVGALGGQSAGEARLVQLLAQALRYEPLALEGWLDQAREAFRDVAFTQLESVKGLTRLLSYLKHLEGQLENARARARVTEASLEHSNRQVADLQRTVDQQKRRMVELESRVAMLSQWLDDQDRRGH